MMMMMNARMEAKADLKASWNEQISEGWISYEDMKISLEMQIDGSQDMSGDELTEDRAKMMGWNLDDMDEDADEWNTWTDIVVESAKEFIEEWEN